VLIGVLLVFVIRPVAGLLGFVGARPASGEAEEGLGPGQQLAASFFGVRGIGSIFYLAYVLTHAKMPQEPWLWSTVAFTIVLSVFVHGVLATPVLSRLERRGEGAAA
jgi:NhaP-type Na+/H+ or K+/H+ antiporter